MYTYACFLLLPGVNSSRVRFCDLDPDCLICRITSVPHQGFLDLSIEDWKEVGLEKPSTIRLSHLVTVEKRLLKVRIGKLSDKDLNLVWEGVAS